MDETLFSGRRIPIRLFVYAGICLVAACLGVLMSFGAQPGGISHLNASIAPMFGPWSQTLPPNPHPVSTWTAQYALFAKMLTVILAFAVVGSVLPVSRWLRDLSLIIAVPALIIWVLTGLMKVISQLS